MDVEVQGPVGGHMGGQVGEKGEKEKKGKWWSGVGGQSTKFLTGAGGGGGGAGGGGGGEGMEGAGEERKGMASNVLSMMVRQGGRRRVTSAFVCVLLMNACVCVMMISARAYTGDEHLAFGWCSESP